MPAKAKTAAVFRKEKAPAAAAGNIFVFAGTDDLRVKEAARAQCRKLLSPEAAEYGLETIEGAADNADHVARIVRNTIEALQTLPFFGGEKVVWLKGVNFLADTMVGKAQATQEALDELLAVLSAGLPPEVKFILSASEVDKRRSFYLNLKKLAKLEVFDLIDTSRSGWEVEVERLVEERAAEMGLRFEEEALRLFVMLAGEDSRQIQNELEKLDLFLGEENRLAREEDVRSIVSPTRTGVVFDLGNALGNRRLEQALALVDELVKEGENAVGILLAGVAPKVRALFQAKMIEERWHPSAASYQAYAGALERLPEKERERLPKKKDGSGLNVFPLFLAAREARRFTLEELRVAREECLKANLRLVTTGLDPVIVLNQLLVRILAPKG